MRCSDESESRGKNRRIFRVAVFCGSKCHVGVVLESRRYSGKISAAENRLFAVKGNPSDNCGD